MCPMAKKMRKPGGRKPQKQPNDLPDLPDRRLLERTMRQLEGGLQERGTGNTPLDKAQEIMYRAFEERDNGRRAQLARKALEICPDFADAYTLLADHTQDRKEALAFWAQAVAAGERCAWPEDVSRNDRPLLGHPRNPPLHAGKRGA